jgi:hypothetical protein
MGLYWLCSLRFACLCFCIFGEGFLWAYDWLGAFGERGDHCAGVFRLFMDMDVLLPLLAVFVSYIPRSFTTTRWTSKHYEWMHWASISNHFIKSRVRKGHACHSEVPLSAKQPICTVQTWNANAKTPHNAQRVGLGLRNPIKCHLPYQPIQ